MAVVTALRSAADIQSFMVEYYAAWGGWPHSDHLLGRRRGPCAVQRYGLLDYFFFNGNVRPEAGRQLVLADEFTSMLDEHDQDTECAASKGYGLVVFQKDVLPSKQAEAPERE